MKMTLIVNRVPVTFKSVKLVITLKTIIIFILFIIVIIKINLLASSSNRWIDNII